MFNISSGRYILKSMFEAKLDILKNKQGRLQLPQYFDRYLQQIHTFEHLGGSIGQDPGLLKYVDHWNEDVINAHPGDAQVMPDTPVVIEIAEDATLSREQVDAFHAPLATFTEDMRTYQDAHRRWNWRRKRYEALRLQASRDMYVGSLLLNNANDDKFGDLKYEINQAYLTGSNNFPMNADSKQPHSKEEK